MTKRLEHILLLLILAAITTIASQSIHAPFILDDTEQLSYVQSLPSGSHYLARDCFGFFRPVKNILFGVLTQLPSGHVQAAHLLSLLLFLAATLLLYKWFGLLYRDRRWALTGTALWALAPTQVSCIVWFSCANITLCLIFMLLSLLLYDRLSDPRRPGTPARYALTMTACAVCFIIAFLSYELAIVLPALALIQDTVRQRKVTQRNTLLPLLVLGVVAAALFVLRASMLNQQLPINPNFAPMSDGALSLSSAYFFMDHILQWLLPYGKQEVLGTYAGPHSLHAFQLAGAWLALLFSAALLHRLAKRAPKALAGGMWTCIALLPMINLVPLRTGPFADYYLIVPSIGLSILLVEILRWAVRLERPARRIVLIGLIVIWRVSTAGIAFQWADTWNDSEALFFSSMQARSSSWRATAELARRHLKRSQLKTAESLARKAHSEAPWFSTPYNIMGDIHNRRGQHAAAREWYLKAVNSNHSDAYTHYALAYTCDTWLHDPEMAKVHYKKSLHAAGFNPYRHQAFLNLGRLFGIGNDPQSAINIFRRGLSEFPASKELQHNLAVATSQLADKNPSSEL